MGFLLDQARSRFTAVLPVAQADLPDKGWRIVSGLIPCIEPCAGCSGDREILGSGGIATTVRQIVSTSVSKHVRMNVEV
jgi:hypothetical protein